MKLLQILLDEVKVKVKVKVNKGEGVGEYGGVTEGEGERKGE